MLHSHLTAMKLSRRQLLLSAAVPLFAQTSENAPRPNILLVVADQMPAWALGCYGNKEIKTPNIDRLSQIGTRFTNSCVCTPASSASRATLLTGRLPRQHGIIDFLTDNPVADPPQGQKEAPASFRNEKLLSDILAGVGYQCGFVGWWHMGNDAQPGHSLSETCTLAGPVAYTNPELFRSGQSVKEQGYLPDVLTRYGMEYIDRQSSAKPFFLTVSYPNAHPPYEGYEQKYGDLYANTGFDTFQYAPAARNAFRGKEMLSDTVGNLRRYAASVSAVDAQLPLLIQKLRDKKLWENTLIVFTSDCGNLLGRHGLWGGGLASNPANLYEEVLQVPMIWSWPGQVPVAGFRPEMISSYDFVPSICDAIKVDVPLGESLCGRSFAELAFGRAGDPKKRWREGLFGEYRNTAMARDTRYKMIVRDGGKGPGELYDLRADAAEMSNEYENREYIAVRQRLTRDLQQWQQTYK